MAPWNGFDSRLITNARMERSEQYTWPKSPHLGQATFLWGDLEEPELRRFPRKGANPADQAVPIFPLAGLDTTVGQLEVKAADNYNQQAVVIGTQFDFIFQDWSKLQTLAGFLQSPDPAWRWDLSTTGRILDGMRPVVEQSYYEALMPAVYALGFFDPQPGSGNWPSAYGDYNSFCDPVSGYCQKPFGSNYAYYSYPNDPYPDSDAGTQVLWAGDGWWGISRRDKEAFVNADEPYQYSPPINTFMQHLFLPRAQGGLNVYRPAFYEGWGSDRQSIANATRRYSSAVDAYR